MFRFRLEPLITIRDNVLKEKQAELGKAYEERRVADEQRTKLEQDLANNLEEGRKAMQPGQIDLSFLLGLRRHEMFLRMDHQSVLKYIDEKDQEIEWRRRAVIEANKELKIIEKLKEKQKAAYDAEIQRRETIEMDEIASIRAARSIHPH